jgi:hypothetical protein
MRRKGLLPKLTPKTFGCAKVPSAAGGLGGDALIGRERVEPPLQPGSREHGGQAVLIVCSTPVCAVLIALSHFLRLAHRHKRCYISP